MLHKSNLGFSGELTTKLIRNGIDAPLRWKIKNVLRWSYLRNVATFYLAKLFSKVTKVITVTGSLDAILYKADGTYINYGRIAHGLVTTAFVDFMVDELILDTGEFGDFKYHDSGVGVTGANVTDVDMETTDGETRVTGSQEAGAAAEIYKSIGTITYSSSKAITEHGVFSKVTGTTLLDRHDFGAINVVNTDQIEFTYNLTVNDGG